MADTIEITREDESTAQTLQKAIGEPGLEAVDVCATWQRVKPYWPWIITVARKIPRVGTVVATALTFIGQALDSFCPK